MVSRKDIARWGGLAFVFGNVLFVVNKLNEMSRLFLGRPIPDMISGRNPGLILLGQVALIIGYVAYYRFYSQRVGRFGRYALLSFTVGGILLAVGHVSFMSALDAESLFLLVVIGMICLLIGLIWFGFLNLRQPMLNRWPMAPAGHRVDGIHWFLPVQRRGDHGHLPLLPNSVCSRSDWTWTDTVAGKASSAKRGMSIGVSSRRNRLR